MAWEAPDLQERAEQRAAARRRNLALLALFRREPAEEQPDFVTVHAGDYRTVVTVDTAELANVDLDPHRELLAASVRALIDFQGLSLLQQDQQANKRSRALLCEWLSSAQLDEFERTGAFTVTGSQGGRYLVGSGLTSELGENGGQIARWCFGPLGVPIYDVMLARKIALETDEAGTRAIANRALDVRYLPNQFFSGPIPAGVAFFSSGP